MSMCGRVTAADSISEGEDLCWPFAASSSVKYTFLVLPKDLGLIGKRIPFLWAFGKCPKQSIDVF